MSTPLHEKDQYSFPAFAPDDPSLTSPNNNNERRSSDEDGTLHNEDEVDRNHLRATTSYATGQQDHLDGNRSPITLSAQREHSRRLDDDLEMLRAERVVSSAEKSNNESMGRSKSLARSRSRAAAEPLDDFDIDTTPIHEKTKIYQPPAHPTTKLAKVFKSIHNSVFLVRWFFYIAPLAALLTIPIIIGFVTFEDASVGGVKLAWFGIWLEIVWLTLWLGRLIAKSLPYPMGLISSLFTNNSKKWRDLGKALEIPATLFFWGLAVEISFLPTMKNHHVDGSKKTKSWENTLNKVIIAGFVGLALNFFEKIIIQLIAISFHLRTYADRIEVNKFQISSLVKLYVYSKDKIAMEDSEFEVDQTGPSSGARTPMAYVNKAQKKTQRVFNRVGDVAGKVAGDFTGNAVKSSTHPHQVVLQLLNSTNGSQVLARRLYRTFAEEDSETASADDLRPAFDNDEESNAAFSMFDKDLNGDISMEELEAVCVEIGRERKAITASLKDLDSVVSKLDDVFMFIVAVITIIVLISIISTSASGVITSAGSTLLALSWLFSATAQEFLQSCIFVFVKHPFDVGDRVTIYGNTGAQMKGDDYFVKEIALLYTEFKKMEGHVVQAPNSYLNTLFILNQRRSGGLAEAVPVTVKFGTTIDQIDTLRTRLLEFVTSENREYQKNILTELTTIYEAHSITLNVVFFYKSNWQNELLRLQRRNKFICAMMVTMHEIGMEGPRMRLAGATQNFPMHLHDAYPQAQPSAPDESGPGPRSGSLARETPFDSTAPQQPLRSHPSILRNRGESGSRQRGESIGAMGKRVDFSLGMSAISSGADYGDVYEDRKPFVPPPRITTTPASPAPARESHDLASEDTGLERMSTRDSGRSGSDVLVSTNSQRTHRNRFFSRGRSRLGTAEEGTRLEDLEAGSRNSGPDDLPDIPEASGGHGASWEDKGGDAVSRIDPRTGIVSPQAVVADSVRETGELPALAGAKGVRRSLTDGWRKR
ncbi:hypothetical protein PZA11_002958 [Diplocarpon coronariae]|uniref:EF-hand domain-containing protein n=1 Tax=Diplocarpon coronariae TaxID=2795749 RepID=A0A218Z5Y0_9HELO|nr:hypothetical protein B2J93_3626 [Marssonina coronariae]